MGITAETVKVEFLRIPYDVEKASQVIVMSGLHEHFAEKLKEANFFQKSPPNTGGDKSYVLIGSSPFLFSSMYRLGVLGLCRIRSHGK